MARESVREHRLFSIGIRQTLCARVSEDRCVHYHPFPNLPLLNLYQRTVVQIIVMSRGQGDVPIDQAEALVSTTVFTSQLDGESLAVIDAKTVDKLGDSGWHVVQSYRLPNLAKGTYALLGTTTFQD